jgi:hypothetical protein
MKRRCKAEVQLQKTSDNISGKTTLETAAKSAVVQKTTSKVAAAQKSTVAQTAKTAAGTSSKIPASVAQQTVTRSFSSLISATGLPSDKLSASIISFARFFSLPLKPELLKHIRQQAFTTTPYAASSSPAMAAENSELEAGTVFKNREAFSLAASAAEGKGVELQPKGLETYAQAIDPELRKKQDGGQHGQRKKNDDDNDNDSEEVSSQKAAAIRAGSLEKMALEGIERNPLLKILNRLPEKDGKRWIVLPFDFSDNDREFKASLRILLETGKTENRACCMALDIVIRSISESGKAEKQRLFVLEPANRLSVFFQPEITPVQQTALVRELSALLEIAPDRIFIKTKKESFPFEAEYGDNLLRSIDEAV